jgi:hypothetical protein
MPGWPRPPDRRCAPSLGEHSARAATARISGAMDMTAENPRDWTRPHGASSGMLAAAFWGFIGWLALLIGATLGLIWRVPSRVIGVVMAFGAGAILTMLADTMMPEGFEAAGNTVGLVTCAGFIAAFLLSHTA